MFKFFKEVFNEINNMGSPKYEMVSVKCPNCESTSSVPSDQKIVKCAYCSSSFENSLYKPSNILEKLSDDEEEDTEDLEDLDEEDDDEFDSDSTPVYGYIEKSGLFYSGEVPEINFSSANLCDSYDECLQQLKKKMREERSSAFYEPPKQNLSEIRKTHPNAKIIKL